MQSPLPTLHLCHLKESVLGYTCFRVCDIVRVQVVQQQARWQEPEAAGQMASTVRKETERDECWSSTRCLLPVQSRTPVHAGRSCRIYGGPSHLS